MHLAIKSLTVVITCIVFGLAEPSTQVGCEAELGRAKVILRQESDQLTVHLMAYRQRQGGWGLFVLEDESGIQLDAIKVSDGSPPPNAELRMVPTVSEISAPYLRVEAGAALKGYSFSQEELQLGIPSIHYVIELRDGFWYAVVRD